MTNLFTVFLVFIFVCSCSSRDDSHQIKVITDEMFGEKTVALSNGRTPICSATKDKEGKLTEISIYDGTDLIAVYDTQTKRITLFKDVTVELAKIIK